MQVHTQVLLRTNPIKFSEHNIEILDKSELRVIKLFI